MARPLRFFIPGLTLHVTQRGSNRGVIFRGASDYEVFIQILRHAVHRYDLQVHAYALMTNHIHLMLTPGTATALPRAMQCVSRRYVQFFNRRYERTGSLWQGRYRMSVIHDERYWLTCMRYVELNPVRAGLAKVPEDYRWSSYRIHAVGEPNALVTPHPLYLALGATADSRREAWRRTCGAAMTPEDLQGIRHSISTGVILGV